MTKLPHFVRTVLSIALALLVSMIVGCGSAPAPHVGSESGVNPPSDEPITGMVLEHSFLETRSGNVEMFIGFPTVTSGEKAAGRFPVIFTYGPYCNYESYPTDFKPREDFVLAGYVHVYAYWIGTCASDGNDFFGDANELAGYDVVEWAAMQPWSTGKVGMQGCSAMGYSQGAVAQRQPPHLVTIAPNCATNDSYEDVTFTGGMMSTTEIAQLGAIIVAEWYGTHLLARAVNDPAGVPTDTVDGTYTPGDWSTSLVLRPNKDEFWDKVEIDLPKINVPVLALPNWDDFSIRGNVRYFTDTQSPHNAMIVGNTGHAYPGPGRSSLEDHLRWYDYWLKGVDNGVMEDLHTKRIQYFMKGANEWRQAANWPIPGTKFTDFYASGDGSGLMGTTGLLSTVAPNGEGTHSYPYQPTQGRHNGQVGYLPYSRHNTPDAQSTLIWNDPTGAGDQRLESLDALSYVTEPLEADTEVTGPVMFTLFASTTSDDTDFVVKLIDVHPSDLVMPPMGSAGPEGPQPGFWDLVTTGRLKGTHRNGHYVNEPIPVGEVVRYNIEMKPTSHLFKAGHRIGFMVASSDAAKTVPNPRPAMVEVSRAQLTATHITLPVISAKQ